MEHKIYIKTLSPIHIGSGNKINPEEYYFHKERLYRLNLDECFSFIRKNVGDELFFDKLNEWTENITYKAETQVNQEARKKYKLGIFDFIKDVINDKELAKELEEKILNDKEFSLYKLDATKIPDKEVSEQIKTANKEVFIPGTSLKGVIRTALLYQVITELPNQEKNKIAQTLMLKTQKARNTEREKKEFDEDLINEFFVCKCEFYNKNTNKKEQKFDILFDIMKFISVNDAYGSTNLNANSSILKLAKSDLYLINGKMQTQAPFIETIKDNINLESRIFINTDYIYELLKLNGDIFDNRGNKIWIGLRYKFDRLFGIKYEELNNKDEIDKKIIDRIFTALKNFSEAAKNQEKIWEETISQNQKSRDKIKAINMKKIYEQITNYENKLKIGWASGFPATTIFLAFIRNELLSNSLKAIFEKFEIGKKSKSQNNNAIDLNRFPASRRFETINDTHVTALGWLAISLKEFSNEMEIYKPEKPLEKSNNTTPPEPKQIELLEKIDANSKSIIAEVIDNSTKPIKVKIFVKGLEHNIYQCSDITNLSSVPKGTIILVKVKDYDKKKKEPRMLGFERMFK